MVKKMLVALLAPAVIAVAPAVAAAAGKAPFPVTIKAANGSVVIKARPTRIVSLSPTATETLFAVGAGPQVAAVDDQSNYPAGAPRTKLSGYTPNVEAIAGYNPDLVVLSNDGGLVSSLQRLGITVLLEPAAANLPQAYDEIRKLGSATGHEAKATGVVKSMQVQITALIRSVPKGSRHLKVFHELEPDLYSATSSTFIGQIYKVFGFRNIADPADSSHTGYPQLSAEYIVSSSPDMVVLADSKCCGQSAKTVAARPGWANISAVKHRRVVNVDDDIASRWGPRVVDFVRAVANAAKRS